MSAASRRKGVRGEREVAVRFEAVGFAVRGLEGEGDHLAILARPYRSPEAPLTLHLETKRAERLRLPEWLEQARAEAPAGVPAVLVFRQNHGRWHVALDLEDFLGMVS